MAVRHTMIVLALVACATTGCGPLPAASSSSDSVVLPSHTPAVAKRSVTAGRVTPDRALTLQVALPLRDEADLDATLKAMYDPSSTTYHQFLTPDTFAAAYHPAAETVQQVRDALQSAGMAVTGVHGTFVQVETDAATAEGFFATELYDYTAPTGETFQAPAAEVHVPADLPIAGVHGLVTGLRHRSHRTPLVSPNAASGLTPATIRQAYNVPSSLTGAGQSLGLFEFDGYTASDVQGYEKTYNLPNVPLTNIFIDNFSGQPGSAADEVTLDIEMMTAMAPNVDEIRVYQIAGDGSDVDMLNEVANPTQGDKKLISIISCSFGNAEDQVSTANLQADNTLFKQMASQGQTFFDASGDSGANDDGSRLSVDQYAGQPYVVGVGGTTLKTNNGAYGSETTWSGSGGGVSGQWNIPNWQTSAVTSASKGSTSKRNAPDVALNADPATGYAIFFQGSVVYGGGGTSFASPLWAGFLALVNQQRATNNLGPIGFFAPALYSLGASSAYGGAFHDIADGSNNGFYPAVTGLDDATGWGTINGVPLVAALSQPTPSGGGTATPTAPANGGGTSAPTSTTTGSGTGANADAVSNVSTATCASVGGDTALWLLAAGCVALRSKKKRRVSAAP